MLRGARGLLTAAWQRSLCTHRRIPRVGIVPSSRRTPTLLQYHPPSRCTRWVHTEPEPTALLSVAQMLARHAVLEEQEAQPERQRETEREQTAVHQVQGWVQSVRLQKRVAFVTLTDGSSVGGLQIAIDLTGEQGSALRDRLRAEMTAGSSVQASGCLVPHFKQPGVFELQINSDADAQHGIEVVGPCRPEEYPLQKKFQTAEFLRSSTALHLRLRTRRAAAIARIRSQASFAVHEFFHSNRFAHIHTPIVTPSDCEGGGEMFRVCTDAHQTATDRKHFFGSDAYLTVSGQLYGEMCASSLRKVYTFGPTFRAENSHTARHLAEFWMVEPEIAFCDLSLLIDTAERLVKHAIRSTLEVCREEVELLQTVEGSEEGGEGETPLLWDTLQGYLDSGFARVTYAEAVAMVNAASDAPSLDEEAGECLGSAHERWLAAHFQGPVFVTHFPAVDKPFYMKKGPPGSDAHAQVVNCVDLYVPGVGELIGGSEREADYDALLANLRDQGIAPEDYQWFTGTESFDSS
jgi:asparaginyl-tRNA synthetase